MNTQLKSLENEQLIKPVGQNQYFVENHFLPEVTSRLTKADIVFASAPKVNYPVSETEFQDGALISLTG